MFEELDVGASHEQATRLLGANQRASAADLDRLFRVPSTADLHERVSLRGSLPAHRYKSPYTASTSSAGSSTS